MKCPYCSHPESKVIDSRDSETGETIRRRRQCESCLKRFTTYERVEYVPLYIVKKEGQREEFDRSKILKGLVIASKKCSIAPSQLEALIDDLENELRTSGRLEIPSREIGEMVMERLKPLSDVAYVRFASVYRSFQDVDQLRKTIEELAHQRAPKRRSRKVVSEVSGNIAFSEGEEPAETQ